MLAQSMTYETFEMMATLLLPLASFLLYLVYRIIFDPLKAVPSPLVPRLTPFWLTLKCRLLNRSQSVHELHQKYGNIVRIAPNHVSIASPGCLQRVYGAKSGTSKGPFYDIFQSLVPIIFSARDDAFHARRRKDLTPAFTKSVLRDFEPCMNAQVLNLKRAFLRKTLHGPVFLNFAPWANFLAFDVIADFVFGKPFGFVDAGEDFCNLISTIDSRMRCLNAVGTLPGWARPWVKWLPFDNFWRMSAKTSMNLQSLAKTSAETRKQQATPDRKDMLSFLIQAKQEDGTPLPELAVIGEAASFISGGSDSTSSTLTYFVDLGSHRPDVVQHLQKSWIPFSPAGS